MTMQSWWTAVLLLLVVTSGSTAAERQPWTTSRIAGTPDPPLAWTTEQVFPSLSFREPVDMACLPGTEWIYVIELSGKVFAFDASVENPQAELVFDARAQFEAHNHSYGLTFHPDILENRFVYLCWTVPGTIVDDGTTVSRFELSGESPPRILPQTRRDIIRWPSGGHNGGCLKFGPDGMLYISAGDGVGPFPPDSEETGQDLSDLRSTIFRIDVDGATDERAYAIPADNPFVDLNDARPEVWAYGFRNPWKMAFDPRTGDLLVGDVGWELWEMVYRVVKGGNYGWSVMEGRQPVRSDVQRGPTPIRPPLVDHDHVEAKSITGGYVYRGEDLPQLQGAYIYGDWSTGKVWGLRHEGDTVTWHEELADTSLAIITFGESEQGDLYIVDYGGSIHRLVPNPRFGEQSDFPRQLSQTGLFDDVAPHAPAAGVIGYSLIAQPWLHGARAERFVALPGTTSISGARNRAAWSYPPGTVFVRTLTLPAAVRTRTGEDPASDRRIETQILHYDDDRWRPYTYVWNDAQTDALLAPAEGAHTKVQIDGREWTWRIHSRTECSTCHTQAAGFTLGFFPQNLSSPQPLTANDQLSQLVESGVFAATFSQRDLAPAVCDPYDQNGDLEERARSYLMVNCAHCHRREAGGNAAIEFPIAKRLADTNAINSPPTQGTFGIPHARIIAPGDPYRSVLYYRMATVGPGHMPHLGIRQVDSAGLRMLHDWIAGMPPPADPAVLPDQLQEQRREDLAAVDALLQPKPDGTAPDAVEASLDRLLDSTTGALRLVAALDSDATPRTARRNLIAAAAHHENVAVCGLFERYLPEAERSRRLGTEVDPAQILARAGDARRGRQLFSSASVQCSTCHRVGAAGKAIGPDLDDVGRRLTREQILQSILEPSRKIEAAWVAHTLVTTDGRVLTGIIHERSADQLVLRDTRGDDHMISMLDIEEQVAQQKSLMPELLVQDLTAGQLADLLAFLASLTSTTAPAAQR